MISSITLNLLPYGDRLAQSNPSAPGLSNNELRKRINVARKMQRSEDPMIQEAGAKMLSISKKVLAERKHAKKTYTTAQIGKAARILVHLAPVIGAAVVALKHGKEIADTFDYAAMPGCSKKEICLKAAKVVAGIALTVVGTDYLLSLVF